jgi:hypothetical protein
MPLMVLVGLLGVSGSLHAAEPVDYARDVKPILARRCTACHGALQQKAALRLDAAPLILKGGDSGAPIVAGHADESLLIEAVSGADGWRMPPEGEPLAAQEIAAIRAWIDQGAEAPDEPTPPDPRRHWAFRPPVRPEVPTVRNAAWVRNPIDAFLAAEHERRGLTPVPPADKPELLRRVCLDLTGLAPSREELHAFLADDSADAYERVVDRLLASPHYGERWGRHWMDVWRYSDWAGYGQEVRNSQPHIWHWRDWIVESLNGDTGYDHMVVAMLAGDEMAPDDPATLRATGYLVRNWYKFNRHVWLQNTVDHTAKAFLGVTLACARCHDHKYDPIAQDDYYRFRAFFEAHDIRTDRVPGQPDVAKDGIPRVYDAHASDPTFLFVRGDDQQPDKDHSLAPGLPRIWGAHLTIEPVSLPQATSYPGLRPYIRSETLAKVEADLAAAEAELARAVCVPMAPLGLSTPLGPPLERGDAGGSATGGGRNSGENRPKASADAMLAEKFAAAARAELESVRTRLAADAVRYATPLDSKRADILAYVASRAERAAAEAKAEEAVARAEWVLADARKAFKPDDPKTKQAETTAEAKWTEARKALETARAAAGKSSSKYTPLSPVYPTTSTGRRLALARWIASRQNPLTARVAVNHIWMRHFGTPLVPTVADFGLNGKPPSHPALLDWLAVEFMERGWSMKALHRLIVTSAAYRMRSSGRGPGDPNPGIDPGNAALWRMNPRRMEAELVRDNVLHMAGGLDPTMGGPDLDQDTGLTSGRRSLYFRHAPEKQVTFLKLFDAANVNACYRRDESIVPQQALALVNSPLALAQSRLLARRLTAEVGDEPSPAADFAFVTAAFEQVLGRAPTVEERSACADYLGMQAQRLTDPGRLTAFNGPANAVAPVAEPRLRAREDLVLVLINHNDFVTIR